MKGNVTNTGYWPNSPDRNNDFNIIPSSNITTKGMDIPLIGISNTGDIKKMVPGKDYKFDGNYVTEFPMNNNAIFLGKYKFANGGLVRLDEGGEGNPPKQKPTSNFTFPSLDPQAQQSADYNKGWEEYNKGVEQWTGLLAEKEEKKGRSLTTEEKQRWLQKAVRKADGRKTEVDPNDPKWNFLFKNSYQTYDPEFGPMTVMTKPVKYQYNLTDLDKKKQKIAANTREGEMTPFAKSLGMDPLDPRVQKRASQNANDQVALEILGNKPQGDRTRVEWLNSLTPEERSTIERSQYASKLDPDFTSQFSQGLEKNLRNAINAFRPVPGVNAFNQPLWTNPDYTQEEAINASALGVLSPLMYPTNFVTGAITGDMDAALQGQRSKPLFTDYRQPEFASAMSGLYEGLYDPMNAVGIGLLEGVDIAGNAARAGKYITPKQLPGSGNALNLEELRRVYHNSERFLIPEESRYLHKHGYGLRENYEIPDYGNNFTTEQASEWWRIRDANRNPLPPPPSEIQFMPDGTTRTVYNQQPIVPTPEGGLFGMTREQTEAAWRNIQNNPNWQQTWGTGNWNPNTSTSFKPKPVNKSGLTKEEVLQKASGKDKDVVSKMSENEFENTVLKPNGEITTYKPGTEIEQMTYDLGTRNLKLKDATQMSNKEYADAFNERLDLLNDIIAQRNKSGVEYRVKGLDENGRLVFETPSMPGAERSWSVKINPGQWRGDVEDIANTEYFRSIPGLEMSNTTSGVFGDMRPRKGSGAYESINEYLKKLDLGRVKPGFNSQTEFSKGAWENFIKSGRGVGFYANPSTVYGTMKTIIPPAAIGTGAAAVIAGQDIPQQQYGGWLQKYQTAGQVNPELSRFMKQPVDSNDLRYVGNQQAVSDKTFVATPKPKGNPVEEDAALNHRIMTAYTKKTPKGFVAREVPGALGSMQTVYENPQTGEMIYPDTEVQQAIMDRREDANKTFNNIIFPTGAGAFYGLSNIASGNLAEGALELAGTLPIPFLKGSKGSKTKQLPGSGSSFKSEIDWAKWNPETPKYPELMNEYNAIEESTKKAGTWMKNPDGSAFQGTPEQFIQQQSSYFKKAFGDSKLINSDGSPQLQYHGGKKGYEQFLTPQDKSYVKRDTYTGDQGIYFTPSKLRAKGYSRSIPKNEREIYETYINMENPYSGRIKGTYGKDQITNKQYEELLTNNYDGVIDKNVFPYHRQTITFDPKNIKSATGNVGFFDMTNPNIYKSFVPAGIGTGAAAVIAGQDIPQQQYGGWLNKYQDGGTSKNRLKKRLLNKYPAMQSVYGTEGENLNIIKDRGFIPAEYGYGNIEFINPGIGLVHYTDDYQYQSPTPDKYTIVYNPRGANRKDIALDMLHGMRDDQNYMNLLAPFEKAVRNSRGNDMEYFYNEDVKTGFAEDGQEKWDKNYIDGLLRAEFARYMAKGKKDYKTERQAASPEMIARAKDIYNYVRGDYQKGGDISVPDLRRVVIKKAPSWKKS